jgi:hypothetical protein
VVATVTLQKLHDGIQKVVVKNTILGDAAGDIVAGGNQLLADVSTFTPAATKVKIMRVQAMLGGFAATLFWDATGDVQIMNIPADTDVDQDFSAIGGLYPTGAAGQTGDIQITTTGLTTGETGYIILHLKKG